MNLRLIPIDSSTGASNLHFLSCLPIGLNQFVITRIIPWHVMAELGKWEDNSQIVTPKGPSGLSILMPCIKRHPWLKIRAEIINLILLQLFHRWIIYLSVERHYSFGLCLWLRHDRGVRGWGMRRGWGKGDAWLTQTHVTHSASWRDVGYYRTARGCHVARDIVVLNQTE